uniref:Uncharacterized protein n=1 Tax=Ditylenchus dipsaci TaxID=166011 RepID=A0A915D219_9BILA
MESAFYTERGKMLDFCNGFSMIFRGVRHRDGLWRWECSSSRCGGTAISTNRNDLVEGNGHYGHQPDVAAVEVTRLTRNRNKDIGAVNRGERSVNWPVHTKNTNEGEQFLYYDSELFSYFERNYVRRPNGNAAFYPTALTNMHDRAKQGLPRTNNGVENWNRNFNSYFRHSNPSIGDFIKKLQADEEKTREIIELRNRNPVSQVKEGMRSKKAIFSREQIQRLVSDYSSGAGLPRMEFLVAIAAHLEKYDGH